MDDDEQSFSFSTIEGAIYQLTNIRIVENADQNKNMAPQVSTNLKLKFIGFNKFVLILWILFRFEMLTKELAHSIVENGKFGW